MQAQLSNSRTDVSSRNVSTQNSSDVHMLAVRMVWKLGQINDSNLCVFMRACFFFQRNLER